jgi:hypothetical protein
MARFCPLTDSALLQSDWLPTGTSKNRCCDFLYLFGASVRPTSNILYVRAPQFCGQLAVARC